MFAHIIHTHVHTLTLSPLQMDDGNPIVIDMDGQTEEQQGATAAASSSEPTVIAATNNATAAGMVRVFVTELRLLSFIVPFPPFFHPFAHHIDYYCPHIPLSH